MKIVQLVGKGAKRKGAIERLKVKLAIDAIFDRLKNRMPY